MKYNDNGEWKDIQVKVANAIQNEYGESNNDGYSQNYLNDHTINVGVNDTDFRVNIIKGKNLSDGASQNVYIDSSVGTCTIISGNTGLYIFVNGGKYTISTTDTQTIYRVGLTTSRPSATQQTLYRGVKKDNTSDSITIDTTGYNFLCLTCTDLSKIQIEKGESATAFEPYVEKLMTLDGDDFLYQEAQNYSTGEKLIGTWIDGKPLYRKVIDFGNLPNTTQKTVDHNISNIENIVNLYGACTNGEFFLPLPTVSTASGSNINMFASNTQIGLVTGSDRSSFKGYVILEYTKTTSTTQNRALSTPSEIDDEEQR